MRLIALCAVVACLAAAPVHAQTPSWANVEGVTFGNPQEGQTFADVQIVFGTYTESTDGGDKPLGLWRLTGPLQIGKPTDSTFAWKGNTCDGWMVASAPSIGAGYTSAWRVEVIPVRVVNDAVTFRLRWVRFDTGVKQVERFSFQPKTARVGSEQKDVELTLRTGESLPIDTVDVPEGAKTVDGHPCGDASIRVSVQPYPWDADEDRLVGVELWLIERLPNGTEAQRSQPLALRGMPNLPLPFYFDRLLEPDYYLDINGTIKTRLATGGASVVIETRYRWEARSRPPEKLRPQRSARSEAVVKTSEIVEVQLPQLEDAGSFAKRKYAIRIRVRQLR